MSNYDERVKRLQGELIKLIEDQAKFSLQISAMRAEINYLKANTPNTEPASEPQPTEPVSQQRQPHDSPIPPRTESAPPPRAEYSQKYEPIFNRPPVRDRMPEIPTSWNLEKFIGENLISKIGIVILVIGVAIGGKYGYDNNWITPLMVVAFFYALGITLVGLAVKLKTQYLNFSAVLLSGGMAIMYFITFFAYSFYGLIDQAAAFVLMAIFTVFTVASAVLYDRQIIAHLGLVGAYFVPFLVSSGSGNYAVLFSYIAIINVGILALSVKKYWKPLFYTSYIATWIIFGAWYGDKYDVNQHFALAFFFLVFYFVTFYITFIVYKVFSKENVAVENVGLVLANSFIFYGFGYSLLKSHAGYEHLLGSFTVANSAIHFAFAFALDRLKLVNKDLVYLASILVLTFITIAAPVQFESSFVTLIWSAEAAFLFWIGRTKQIPIFENFAYPMVFLASVSLLNNWAEHYIKALDYGEFITPFVNSNFAIGIFFIAAMSAILLIDRNEDFESSLPEDLKQIVFYLIPAILIFAIYNVFRMEIGNYFGYLEATTPIRNASSDEFTRHRLADFTYFNILWQLNYSMLFLAICGFLNIQKFKNTIFGFVNLLLNGFASFVYLTAGLFLLNELRTEYFRQTEFENPAIGIMNIAIRYICAACFAALCYSTYRYIREEFLTNYVPKPILQTLFDPALSFAVLILISVELVTWLDVFGYTGSFKLGLSILWGVYALFLIATGIVLKKLHLRIFAIALFAITLLKLFFYDIADLDTIKKTIVFVSLGILLLIISFLYTKYKNVIFDE